MPTNPFPRGLYCGCLALLSIALAQSAAAQNTGAGANQAPATLQIRAQVAPVAAFLPPAPAPKDSSIASVVYNMPRDVLSMSLSEEIRPLRPGDKAFLPPGAGVADGTLKTMTIVLR